MRLPTVAALVVALLLSGCGKEPARDTPVSKPATAGQLTQLFDDHFERMLELNPLLATEIGDDRYNDRLAITIGPEYRAALRALDEEFLSRLLQIERDALPRSEQLSYDMFRLNREMSLEGDLYPSHLQPINQFYSMPNTFARLGSGKSIHPFRTVKDYEDFLSRIDDFDAYVDQAIVNMKEGMRVGVVQPRVLMEKVVPQLEAHVVDEPEASGFFAPIRAMPEEFPDSDRQRLRTEYRAAIRDEIVPAYARLLAFINDEYLGAARDTFGLYALPDGREWYAHNVRRITTTELTPDEIHQIGLDEVARIHDEMRGVMDAVAFDGNLQDFFSFMYSDPTFFFSEPEELIQAYRDMADDVARLAPRLFNVFPKTPFEVRRVEPFRERSASKGSYQSGTPDGSRPGVFYANAYDVGSRPKWDMRSLFLHEAIPGHHFQISLQQEADELPRFRRFGGYTAFVEGWGLYAEFLGHELGLYADPYDHFGALNAELWRSIRLVTDTGIHAKGWTRQQVLDYMYANSAVSETRAIAEAERFMAIPGQALAYKIGQLKLLEIRRDAESRLGANFDVREFHTQVLMDGPMPLSMLEDKIQRWVEAEL